ncbi:MFS transporter [Oxalobacteraceae bacterium OTU3CINTB1]|nr:MFS transporter [Oxalobacteraceae bacterium OTU3CINTB1]
MGWRHIDAHQRNVPLLLVCQTLTTLCMMTLVPIMPLYVASLSPAGLPGDPDTLMRWANVALAAPGLGALCCAPFAGRWCDRYGYRRMLLVSLAVFIASVVLIALSTNLACFIAGRWLQGASAIGLVLTAFIGRAGDDSVRGRNLGLQESAIGAGALLGPVIGGAVLDYWSLRPMLLATALFTAIAAALLWLCTSEPRAGDRAAESKPRPRPDRDSAAGIRPSPSSVQAHEFRGLATVMRHPELRRWMLAGCLTQAAGFAMLTVFALYISARFPALHAPGSIIGSLHALGWLATIVAGPVWGRLNDRGKVRRHFAIAAATCALSSALLMAANALWAIALLRLIQGACYAALTQSMLLACLRQLPASVHGHVTGLGRGFMTAGQLLGPMLVIACAPLLAPRQLPWLVAALFLMAGLLVWRPAGRALPLHHI